MPRTLLDKVWDAHTVRTLPSGPPRGKQLRTPNVRARLAAKGGDVLDGTPGEFSVLLKSHLAHWGAIVKQTGAKVD